MINPNLSSTLKESGYQQQFTKSEQDKLDNNTDYLNKKTTINQEISNQQNQVSHNQRKQDNNQLQQSSQKYQIIINKDIQSQNCQKHVQSLQEILQKNKFLKEIFKHFCNMTYADTRKKTFQEMQKNKQTMSLNRFMLFSKQFNIYQLISLQLKSNLIRNPSMIGLKINTEQTQNSNKQRTKSQLKNQNPMLQIPVKNIENAEKKLTKIYRSHTQKYDQMSLQQFVDTLTQIFQLYQKHFHQLYPKQSPADESKIQKFYFSKLLFIDDVKQFQQKMISLKIEFKGSISYHQMPTQKSALFSNKKLVIHGGRSPQEMKNQLQIYQSSKLQKTSSWIEKQPQMTRAYSKSRIFYKPNPSRHYQTNDVIRLARKQAGRTLTESLFDDKSHIREQKRENKIRKQEGLTFSKIFEDKTNKFSEKLEKFKKQFAEKSEKERQKRLGRQEQKQKILGREEKRLGVQDDSILEMYFENQRKIYGDESFCFEKSD